ncbi:peptidylprolyl isomerase [Chitinophaga silvatica]|uniref:Peptidyl-prolyl cis-trans isomerase n=1 Tax=Chitinophaga silvatica TaxID=2282649 RepID=A0A3E1Y6R7_9BACT|nr:FKBP-type peptidyl-prolyl cis-trans isomerase [Chitinophaga silvatica]RFS20591.1 peptidylprolyl isomerase [Chitinophaga silvatica]
MKIVVRLFSTCLLFTLIACAKNKDGGFQMMDPASDISIQAYLRQQNDTTAIKDISGIYYTIIKPGDGVHFCKPTSVPSIVYSSKLLNGRTVFSSFVPTDFDHRELKNHIPGWQIGLLKISVGGKIRLYIPPEYAYGNVGVTGVIPPNAILISEIELVSIVE